MRPVIVTVEGNQNPAEVTARIAEVITRALNEEYARTAPQMRRDNDGVHLYFHPHDIVGSKNEVVNSETQPAYETLVGIKKSEGVDVYDMRPFSVEVRVQD